MFNILALLIDKLMTAKITQRIKKINYLESSYYEIWSSFISFLKSKIVSNRSSKGFHFYVNNSEFFQIQKKSFYSLQVFALKLKQLLKIVLV